MQSRPPKEANAMSRVAQWTFKPSSWGSTTLATPLKQARKPPLFRGWGYNECYVKGQKEETKGKDCTSPLPLKSCFTKLVTGDFAEGILTIMFLVGSVFRGVSYLISLVQVCQNQRCYTAAVHVRRQAP